MTASQRERIAEMRLHNYSYSFIGRALDLPTNTVKSYCRRQGLVAEGPRKTKAEKNGAVLCRNCHRPLSEMVRKDAAFCSDSCRAEYRRKNRKVREIKP